MSNVVNLGGRPEKYLPDYSRQAEFLCRMGATRADLAEFFEVAPSQIQAWACRHEEFGTAIRVGKEPADDRVEQSFYMRCVGFTHATQRTTREVEWFDDEETGERRSRVKKEVTVSEETYYPPEWGAAFAWLKNRRPAQWRDRHDLNGNVRVAVTQSDQELYDPAWLATLSFDEIQRLTVDEIQASYTDALARAGEMLNRRQLPKPDKPN